MIEDALKTARSTQRFLLITASVAALFLFSLRDVSREEQFVSGLKSLTPLDREHYAEWINEWVAHISRGGRQRADATTFQAELSLRFEEHGLQPEGVHRLIDAIGSPVSVWRAEPERLVPPRSRLTLRDLRELERDRDLHHNAQVTIAAPEDFSNLAYKITAFLMRMSSDNMRIEDVELEIDDTPTTRVPGQATRLLVLKFVVSGVNLFERFETSLQGRTFDLPDSSWLEWQRSFGVRGVSEFLKTVDSLNLRLSEDTPVTILSDNLEDFIGEAQADNRSIALPGISIPGSLALFAIPLLIVGLLLALQVQVHHLRRFAASHRDTYLQFSWSALAPGRAWLLEVGVVLLLIPTGVHLILLNRSVLLRPSLSGFMVALVGALAGASSSLSLLWAIRLLRTQLGLKEQWWPTRRSEGSDPDRFVVPFLLLGLVLFGIFAATAQDVLTEFLGLE